SMVAKIACAPTAQPRRGPTIWMAASAGTKAGSTPDGVGVGVGDGESLAEEAGEADGLGEGDAVGVSDAGGLIAAAGAQPPRRMATATTGKPRLIRRSEVPTACLYDEAGAFGHAPCKPVKNVLAYAHGICHTLTAKTRVRFGLRSVTCFAGGEKKRSGP